MAYHGPPRSSDFSHHQKYGHQHHDNMYPRAHGVASKSEFQYNNQAYEYSESYDDSHQYAESYENRESYSENVEYGRGRNENSFDRRKIEYQGDQQFPEDYSDDRYRGRGFKQREDGDSYRDDRRYDEDRGVSPFGTEQRPRNDRTHKQRRHNQNYTEIESITTSDEELGRGNMNQHLDDRSRFRNYQTGLVESNHKTHYDYGDRHLHQSPVHMDVGNSSDDESVLSKYMYQRSFRNRKQSNRAKTLIRKRSKFLSNEGTGGDFNESRRSTLNRGTLPSYQRDKAMSLQQKMELLRQQSTTHDVAKFFRDQIVSEPVTKLKGFSAWRKQQQQTWQRFKLQAKSVLYQLEPWAGALKSVEGKFGTSIMSYFRFVRWLMFLNLYISIVMVGLVLVPHLVLSNSPANFEDPFLKNDSRQVKENITSYEWSAVNCTCEYKSYLQDQKENIASQILDFLQGTGWMEYTVLFYGVYFNKTYPPDQSTGTSTYNMSLSYLLATGVAFIISFILIVKNSAKGMKGSSMSQGGTITLYCNKVLAGWDFCICDEKAAERKKKNISAELKNDLEEQKLQWMMASRTTRDLAQLYLIRGIINFAMLGVLIGALYLIYYSFEQLLTLQKMFGNIHPVVEAMIQYLPSLTITILNVVVPIIFKKVVILEKYSPIFEMRMTLLRTILLRLASLGVLMVSLYNLLEHEDNNLESACGNKRWAPIHESILNNTNTSSSRDSSVVKCWETYVGQQMYKLVLMDFLVTVIVTFLVEFPRSLVYSKLRERLKLVEMIGLPEVDLPKIVLDLVYGQTLCWFGLFFSPLIPLICFAKFFIFFYVKKLSLMNNYIPPVRPYRTSRSNSLFIGMLFISFIIACVPMTYLIGKFSPSMSCGPFRVYSKDSYMFFDTVAQTIRTWPWQAQNVFFFFGTTSFFIPAIFIMCLITYYFWAMKEGYLKMEDLLQEQLKVEGRDKQFLLARVNEVWEHQEQGQT